MFSRLILVAFGLLPAFSAVAASAEVLSPKQVMQRFDSLLNEGNPAADSEAKALCAGTALRMFSFLAEAEHKFAPYLDSSKSHDTVVEEKCREKWCALKEVSDAVFRKPLMGMDQMHSVQAVNLFKEPGGWKISEFEELSNEKVPLVVHEGAPAEASEDTASHPLFPVSKLAPDQNGVTRMRMRISLGDGDSLPEVPQGPGQSILQRGKEWAVVETKLPEIPPSPLDSRTGIADSLKAYLGSGSYLDLNDSLLISKALELSRGTSNPLERAHRVYDFVLSSFHFKLGAALFSDSREALRSLEGDCSEAAVLTTALLRAEDIPSRVDLGFATMGRGVFIGHAWSEAFINGKWVGVDAALREFPAGAQRILLQRLSGDQDMQVAVSNLMLRSLSNLNIEITGAWAGPDTVPLYEHHGNAKEGEAFFEEVLKGVGQ